MAWSIYEGKLIDMKIYPLVIMVSIPGIVGFLTIANLVPEWPNYDTWICLQKLTSVYFTKSSRYVFFEDGSPPSWLWYSVPVYNFKRFGETTYMDEADGIFIQPQIDINKTPSVSGRVIIVTRNLDGVENLWRSLKLTDALVLVQSVTDCSLYSWFPYEENNCPSTPDVKLIGKCHDRTLTTKSELFPSKIPKKFKNCTLLVCAITNYPYFYNNGTKGIDVTFFSSILNNIGLTYELVDFPYSFIEYFTHQYPNGSLSGLHKILHDRDVDIAAGDLMIRIERNAVADPLPSSHHGPLEFFAPTPSPKPQMAGLYSGFSNLIWCLIAFIFTLLTLALYFASNLNFMSSVFTTLKLVLGICVPLHTGSPRVMKFLVIAFHLYSICILCLYQTTLLSSLFQVPLEKPYASLDDIADARLKICLNPLYLRFLNFSNRKAVRTLLSNGNAVVNDVFNLSLLTDDKSLAIFSQREMIASRFKPLYPRTPIRTKLLILEEKYSAVNGAMYMPKNHPLYSILSVKVFQVLESGLLNLWKEREFDVDWGFVYNDVNDKKPLQLRHFHAAFYFYAILLSLSIAIFLFELIFYQFKLRN